MRTLTYFVATSVDGFIGAPDGDGEFFNRMVDREYARWLAAEYPETIPTHVHAQLGLGADTPARHFDTVIMGRGTYDVGLKDGVTSPYGHLEQYVVSRSLAGSPDPAVQLISGDVVARVRELKQRPGLGIWLCGGADLAAQLVDEIDAFVVKTYPVLLGTGMPMSRAGFALRGLELTRVESFPGGQTVSAYARRR
ncbi:dihydrofolate reductase family protein [Streptomyces antimicrobicus]|uniref:Dihydrofolate reductase family protein n=1 Tax=Streptomyces antimicrobicus TaxID=2883108 RepID=A0ABS8B6D4_9ACTN|nr:dihydrofolate reductase family protein [Streptomyces antimicrobicus]MCB5180158.1 dihydrofolate reductase family protein [Streptomyces antimicrobicus]